VTPTEERKLYGVSLVFDGNEFTIDSGRLYAGDHIDSVQLSSSGAPASATPGTYDIQIADAQGVGLGNYRISYVSAPSGLQVVGASTVALSDTLTSLHQRPEHLDTPEQPKPLVEIVDGGMRLPDELSDQRQGARP
jgi:hypothetical protein